MAEFDGKREVTEEKDEQKKREQETGKRDSLPFAKGFLCGVVVMGILSVGITVLQVRSMGRNRVEIIQSDEAAGQSDGGEETGIDVLTGPELSGKLAEIEEKINDYYLNEVDEEQLVSYLCKGLTVGLDDPYANYYTPQELERIMEANEGEYFGIGATLLQDRDTGRITVVSIYEGSPAEEAGLQVDDEICSVNGEDVSGMDLTNLVAEIKGNKDTFTMGVIRSGSEEPVVLEMKCREVISNTVAWEMLEDSAGYIKITEFDSVTVDQFTEAYKALKEQGMEKLVVDVRDNPGGLLDSVCNILDFLLPEGIIVYTEDKNGTQTQYRSDDREQTDIPVAVLVNGNSASAAEIFAGAIQDYGLGPVVGTTTFGKGIVQKTFSLSDGSALKLTTEKYFTPKGEDIHEKGITPDVVIEAEKSEEGEASQAEDVQLQAALAELNK